MGWSYELCVLVVVSTVFAVEGFLFTVNSPGQCDNFTISWTGGRPPFEVLLVPAFNVPQHFSLPPSAFDAATQNGSFTTQLTFPQAQRFLVVMSDADGFATGGTSDLLTTGPSVSAATCNTTRPNPDFFFQLNSALQQCRPYVFSDYPSAIQPITIKGFIPLGQSFILQPPRAKDFEWVTNVAAGTSLLFVMSDARGRSGGTSDLTIVGWSDSADCLDASSPSSTAKAAASATGVATTTTTVLAASGARVPPAAVVGAVFGAVVLTVLALLLVLFLLRRRRKKRAAHQTAPDPVFFAHRRPTIMSSRRSRGTHPVDLLHQHDDDAPSLSSDTLPPPAEYEPNPFIMPSDDSAHDGHSPHRTASHTAGGTNPRQLRHHSIPHSATSEAARRKAATAGITSHHTPPRFILHTDLDDSVVDLDTVVELPPQYNPARHSRPPLHGQDTPSDPPSS